MDQIHREIISKFNDINRPFTHVIYEPYQEISIPDDKIEGFWSYYCNKSKSIVLNIGEMVRSDHIPIIIHFPCKPNIESIITSVRDIISKMVDTEDLTTVVLSSPTHIQLRMIYCRLPSGIISSKIYPAISRIIPDIDYQYINQPIPLYGSVKSMNEEPMVILRIYNNDGSIGDLSLLSPIYHQDYINHRIHDNIFVAQPDPNFWLPFYLSINYYPYPSKLIIDYSKVKELLSNSSVGFDENDLVDLLSMISPNRLQCSVYYITIGKALHYFYKGSQDGLRRWQSLDTTDELRDKCSAIYHRLGGSPITYRTIAWYAWSDNKDRYEKWHEQWCNRYLEVALNTQTDADIGECIYRHFWLHFLCCNKTWYYFNGVRWCPDENMVYIQRCIRYLFRERCKVYGGNINDVEKIDKRLSDTVRLNRILKQAMIHFHINDIDQYMDSQVNIIGTKNMVIEITPDNDIVVREPKPEDYITKSTNNYWKDDLSWDTPEVKECMTWFNQLFPDINMRDYFLKVVASCLKYGNFEKSIYILYGHKDGAKSSLKRLFEYTLGDYVHNFPMTTFTKQLNALSPEAALSKGTLIGFIQEPSVNDQINDGFLKMITGNDTFFTRKLYDNGGTILPIFKVFLMCNRIPYIPAADDAVKERLVIIPCKSKWVHNAPDSIDEQYRQRTFKVDPNFYNHRLPNLGSAMLWIMVKYFPRYVKELLYNRPKEVEDTIREFWEENDVFLKFYRQCLMVSDNNIRLPVDAAFNEFKNWYMNNFPGFKAKITVNTFKDEISKYIGKPQRGGWIGVKLVGYITM